LQIPPLPTLPWSDSRGKSRTSAAEPGPPGTGFLDSETGPPKSPPETRDARRDQNEPGSDSGNPRTNGLSGPNGKLPGSEGLDGGGDGDRTCDPLVNEAGSRMIKSETFCESAESSRGRRVSPVWRGGPGGTTLERCLPPLAHAASPVLSVAAAPAHCGRRHSGAPEQNYPSRISVKVDLSEPSPDRCADRNSIRPWIRARIWPFALAAVTRIR
jgi:hypothetical protein